MGRRALKGLRDPEIIGQMRTTTWCANSTLETQDDITYTLVLKRDFLSHHTGGIDSHCWELVLGQEVKRARVSSSKKCMQGVFSAFGLSGSWVCPLETWPGGWKLVPLVWGSRQKGEKPLHVRTDNIWSNNYLNFYQRPPRHSGIACLIPCMISMFLENSVLTEFLHLNHHKTVSNPL